MINLSFPVEGMTCGNCASRVEIGLSRLQGVSRIVVDLASKKVNISYNPNQVDLLEFQYALQEAGYSIPTKEVTFHVEGMHCLSCVSRIESAVNDLPGVLQVSVSLSNATAHVIFVPAIVELAQMLDAVRGAGYSTADRQSDNLTPSPDLVQNEQPLLSANTAKFVWRFKQKIRRS